VVSPKEEIRNLAARITSILFCNKSSNEALDHAKEMFKELSREEVSIYISVSEADLRCVEHLCWRTKITLSIVFIRR